MYESKKQNHNLLLPNATYLLRPSLAFTNCQIEVCKTPIFRVKSFFWFFYLSCTVFNSGPIDNVVPFPSRQESRQLLGDKKKKIYAVYELCLTGKNSLYKRECLTWKEKSHTTE